MVPRLLASLARRGSDSLAARSRESRAASRFSEGLLTEAEIGQRLDVAWLPRQRLAGGRGGLLWLSVLVVEQGEEDGSPVGLGAAVLGVDSEHAPKAVTAPAVLPRPRSASPSSSHRVGLSGCF